MVDSGFLDESIALLERTPRVVRELLEGLPESWLTERDTPEGWQARDVVGHLISAELDDWMPRVEIIMRDGTGRAFDSFDRFQHEHRDVGVPLSELIDRFASLRAEGISRLRELVTDDFRPRTARDSPRAGRSHTAPAHRHLDGPRPRSRGADLLGVGRRTRRRGWAMEGIPRNTPPTRLDKLRLTPTPGRSMTTMAGRTVMSSHVRQPRPISSTIQLSETPRKNRTRMSGIALATASTTR